MPKLTAWEENNEQTFADKKRRLWEEFRRDPKTFADDLGLNRLQSDIGSRHGRYTPAELRLLTAMRNLEMLGGNALANEEDLYMNLQTLEDDLTGYVDYMGKQVTAVSSAADRDLLNGSTLAADRLTRLLDGTDPLREIMAGKRAGTPGGRIEGVPKSCGAGGENRTWEKDMIYRNRLQALRERRDAMPEGAGRQALSESISARIRMHDKLEKTGHPYMGIVDDMKTIVIAEQICESQQQLSAGQPGGELAQMLNQSRNPNAVKQYLKEADPGAGFNGVANGVLPHKNGTGAWVYHKNAPELMNAFVYGNGAEKVYHASRDVLKNEPERVMDPRKQPEEQKQPAVSQRKARSE